jgi:hypothetical protein
MPSSHKSDGRASPTATMSRLSTSGGGQAQLSAIDAAVLSRAVIAASVSAASASASARCSSSAARRSRRAVSSRSRSAPSSVAAARVDAARHLHNATAPQDRHAVGRRDLSSLRDRR